MDGERVLFDASSYMFFEASGDSEAGFFDTAVEEELGPAAAEDDALSCSCGWFSGSAAVHEIDSGGDDFYSAGFDDCNEEGEEEEEDGHGGVTDLEDGVVDQCCGGGGKATAAAREDPSMNLMKEGETDRLFWEACLAS